MGRSITSIRMDAITEPPEFSAVIAYSVVGCKTLGMPEITPDWLIDSPGNRSGLTDHPVICPPEEIGLRVTGCPIEKVKDLPPYSMESGEAWIVFMFREAFAEPPLFEPVIVWFVLPIWLEIPDMEPSCPSISPDGRGGSHTHCSGSPPEKDGVSM